MWTALGGHAVLVVVITVLVALGVELVLILHGALPVPYGDAVEPDPYLWSLYRADAGPYVWATYVTPEYTSTAPDVEDVPHCDPRGPRSRRGELTCRR
ncbi:MAG TPA: hypothetical protein VEP50_16560 [bacterium]|nr:hypothetical protein [bacterium]